MWKSIFQQGNVNFPHSYETLHCKLCWLMLFRERKVKPQQFSDTHNILMAGTSLVCIAQPSPRYGSFRRTPAIAWLARNKKYVVD